MKDNKDEFTKMGTKKDPAKKKSFAVQSFRLSLDNDFIQKPKFEEDKKKGYIKYGDKNLFPDFLLEVFFKSGKHNAIINRKIKMIAGKGFEQETEATKNEQGLYPGKTTAKLLASDLEIFKGYALFLRWNVKKDKVIAYDYLPFHKVRQGINEGTFFVSEDWSATRKDKNKPVEYFEFTGEKGLSAEFKSLPKLGKGASDKEKEAREDALRKETVEVCYFTDVSVGTDAYPIPNYFSNIEWVLTDSEIGEYSLNLVLNEFLGGFHIGFKNGIPEEDEREEEKKAFEKEYTGSNGKRVIITFSEPESEGVDFNPLPSAGNENILENTEKRAATNIFIAHEVVDPILFGIKDGEGGLGRAKNEMIESLAIFQAVYIDDQQELIEDTFLKVFSAMGQTDPVNLKTYSIGEMKAGEKPEVEFTITNKKK